MLSVTLGNSASSTIQYKQYKHTAVYFVSLMKKGRCEVSLIGTTCGSPWAVFPPYLEPAITWSALTPSTASSLVRAPLLSCLTAAPHGGLSAPALPFFSLFPTQQPEWAFWKKSSPVAPLLETLPWLLFSYSKIPSIDQALHDPFVPLCPPAPSPVSLASLPSDYMASMLVLEPSKCLVR